MCEQCLDETTLLFHQMLPFFLILKIISHTHPEKHKKQNLDSRKNSLRLLWSRFSFFEANFPLSVYYFDRSSASGVKWCNHASSLVMNRRQKSALLLQTQHTHLTHSFLIYKSSGNIRCTSVTSLFEMTTIMSASFRTFNPRASNMYSSVITSFGRPLRCSSWQLVRTLSLNILLL